MRALPKLILWIVLLTLFAPVYASAQEYKIRFGHLFLEEERWQGRVYDILQDEQGFMWFGTRDGLYKYDGYSLIAYKNAPDDPGSLSDNRIRAIHQDRSGTFWIGTVGGGLNRFWPETEQFIRYRYNENDPYSLGGDDVRLIFEDRDGNLWIGTNGGGLNRFVPETDDGQAARFIRYQPEENDPYSLSDHDINVLFEDRNGELWIGTADGGLNRFDRGTEQFTRYQHEKNNPHSLGDNEVLAIFEDQFGTLWIGTREGGLCRFDRETGQCTNYRHDPDDPHSLGSTRNGVYTIYEDRAGALWIGTLTGGVNRFDRETGQFTRYEISDGESIYTILEDQTGELWMGGLKYGLYRYDRAADNFLNYRPDDSDPYSLGYNLVWTIYEDRAGGLWFGTWGGADTYHRTTAQFTNYAPDPNDPQSLSHKDIQPIYEDRAGEVWIGTKNGLNRWKRGTDQFVHYFHDDDDPQSLSGSYITAIYEEQSGTFWVGTLQHGLNVLDRETGQAIHYRHDKQDPHSLSSDFVKVIYQDRLGTLWIGTREGLNRFDPTTKQFIRYYHNSDDPGSLSSDNILSLYEDRQGTLWVGTHHGLNRFDHETEQFSWYQAEPENPQGLTNDTILVIYEDRAGRFWIGTDAGGLHQFDRETETFVNYRMKHGLPSDVVYGILEDDASPGGGISVDGEGGNLWLSTTKGLSKFNPQAETFKNYDVHNGLQSNRFNVRSSYQLQSGEMLFGGADGLTIFDPKNIEDNPYIPPVVLTDFKLFNQSIKPSSEKGSLLQKTITYVDALTLSHEDYIISFEFAGLDYALPEKNRYAYKLENFEEDWNYTTAQRRFATYTSLPAGEYAFRVKAANNDGVWNEEGTSLNITVLPPWWETWWFRGIALALVVGLIAGGYRWRVRSIENQRRQLEIQVAERTNELSESNQRLELEIAERKQAENALRASEAQARAMLNATTDAAVQLDPDGIVLDLNEAYAERFDKRRKDLIGTRIWSLFPTDIAEQRMKLVDTVFQTGTPVRREDLREGIWNDYVIYPVRDVWDNITSVVVFAHDITERKQAEERLRQAKEAADEARKMAETANQAKSTFLANMSHELRTPLNVILGFTQIMSRRQNLSPEQQENLGIISRSGEHLLTLINQVLEISKIEAGRITLDEVSFDLHRLLDDLEGMFRMRAEDKGLQLIFDRTSDVPQYVYSDEVKLRQVLINLLNNALKFTPEGGVKCQVSGLKPEAKNEAPDACKLLFEISDTGLGIAASEMNSLFEAFTQTEVGQQTQEGTGLGLPISRKFVQLMDGDITVSSEVGQGTTFTFDIQVGVVSASDVESKVSHRVIALKTDQRAADGGPYRILIVDDKWDNRQLLIKLLTSASSPTAGFELREAENGQQAIEIWQEFEPHLIWMDMRMPVLDGYEATKRIKATAKGQATAIIALTASSLEEERAKILLAGCDDFVRKPFREPDIFETMSKHIGVRYVYEEDAESQQRGEKLDSEALKSELANLPSKLLLRNLAEATELSDMEMIEQVIAEIRNHNAPLADALAQMAGNFEYDKISNLLEQ